MHVDAVASVRLSRYHVEAMYPARARIRDDAVAELALLIMDRLGDPEDIAVALACALALRAGSATVTVTVEGGAYRVTASVERRECEEGSEWREALEVARSLATR